MWAIILDCDSDDGGIYFNQKTTEQYLSITLLHPNNTQCMQDAHKCRRGNHTNNYLASQRGFSKFLEAIDCKSTYVITQFLDLKGTTTSLREGERERKRERESLRVTTIHEETISKNFFRKPMMGGYIFSCFTHESPHPGPYPLNGI